MSNISSKVNPSMQMEIHPYKRKMDSNKIIDALQKGVVTIVFEKIDTKEIRTMPCTLNQDISQTNNAGRKIFQ